MGLPTQQRYDWEADGVNDTITDLFYDAEDRLVRSDSDGDADGVADLRTTYTYECRD